MMKLRVCAIVLFAGTWLSSPANADIIFTAPPRENLEKGRQVYQPIAEHLTRLLGKKVTYKHPTSWLEYQIDMRKDKYDIVFDAAHFVSWRSKNLDATPIIRLPGTSNFFILVDVNNSEINNADDLIGKKTCGIGPPNLGTLTIFAQFPNPVRQPIIYTIKGGFMKSFKTFKEGKCVAVVLRENVYKNKLTDADRASMKTIVESELIPNQGVTISTRISRAEGEKIVASFTNGDGIKASKNLLNRFAKGQKAFISTSKKEYEGYSKYLEGIIFGW